MSARSTTWWRHQMEAFSALLALCAGNSPVPVNSPHKGQWRGTLMFSFICTWIHGWVNTCDAGDLRRHRGHYDANVMNHEPSSQIQRRALSSIMYLYQITKLRINTRRFRLRSHDKTHLVKWGRNPGQKGKYCWWYRTGVCITSKTYMLPREKSLYIISLPYTCMAAEWYDNVTSWVGHAIGNPRTRSKRWNENNSNMPKRIRNASLFMTHCDMNTKYAYSSWGIGILSVHRAGYVSP